VTFPESEEAPMNDSLQQDGKFGPHRTVVLDLQEYEDLLYTIDLLKGILVAEREVREGGGIPHEQVMAELRAKYGCN
jgi:hypothetical protein